ncbi:hypothetical protein Dsin_002766 [Dipteronia sinensis]|uniref:Uncharacterized protein n=1 Tax=Dipteronia sinensis TaxID=43782 RepID=A0AAE0B7T9_9ROSI|nr:hypothetical protein Dsin_002766 [Dipteronia sinensis]
MGIFKRPAKCAHASSSLFKVGSGSDCTTCPLIADFCNTSFFGLCLYRYKKYKAHDNNTYTDRQAPMESLNKSILTSKVDSPVTGNLRSSRFNDLKNATKNFRQENLLREGGFGCVSKGWIVGREREREREAGMGGGGARELEFELLRVRV